MTGTGGVFVPPPEPVVPVVHSCPTWAADSATLWIETSSRTPGNGSRASVDVGLLPIAAGSLVTGIAAVAAVWPTCVPSR